MRIEQTAQGKQAVQIGTLNVLAIAGPPSARQELLETMLAEQRQFRKHARRALIVTVLCAAAAVAAVVPAYAANKCVVGGKVVYQDAPCEGGKQVNLSGAGTADPGAQGSSYYRREGARLAAQEKAEAAAKARGETMQNAIAKREVVVGMTDDEVRRSWGDPTRVNISVSSRGHTEQWVYDRGGSRAQYVYLDNGVVSSIQSSK